MTDPKLLQYEVLETGPQLQQQRCVEIHGPQYVGTGYLIGPKHVGTAAHVMGSAKKGDSCDVRIGVGSSAVNREGRLLECSAFDKEDVALLVLDSPVDFSPFSFASDARPNDRWEAWGFPTVARIAADVYEVHAETEVRTPTVRLSGFIHDLVHHTDLGQQAIKLQVDRHLESSIQGMSGSAVTVNGLLVGHVTRHMPRSDNQELAAFGQVWACSSRLLQSWLTDLGVAFRLETTRPSPEERLRRLILRYLADNVCPDTAPPATADFCIDPRVLSVIENVENADTTFLEGAQVRGLQDQHGRRQRNHQQRLAQARQAIAQRTTELSNYRSELLAHRAARPPSAPTLHRLFDADLPVVRSSKLKDNDRLVAEHTEALKKFEEVQELKHADLQAKIRHAEWTLGREKQIAEELTADWERLQQQHLRDFKAAFASDATVYLSNLIDTSRSATQQLIAALSVIGLNDALLPRLAGMSASAAALAQSACRTAGKTLDAHASDVSKELVFASLRARNAVRKSQSIAEQAIKCLDVGLTSTMGSMIARGTSLTSLKRGDGAIEHVGVPTDEDIARGLASLAAARRALEQDKSGLHDWIKSAEPLVARAHDAVASAYARLEALNQHSRSALELLGIESKLSVLVAQRTGVDSLDEQLAGVRTAVEDFLKSRCDHIPHAQEAPPTSCSLSQFHEHDVIRFLKARTEADTRLDEIDSSIERNDEADRDLQHQQERAAEALRGMLMSRCALSLVPILCALSPVLVGSVLASARDALRSANPHYLQLTRTATVLVRLSAGAAIAGACICTWQTGAWIDSQKWTEDVVAGIGWTFAAISYATSAGLFFLVMNRILPRRKLPK